MQRYQNFVDLNDYFKWTKWRVTKWPHRCDTHPVAQCTTLQPCWQKLGQEVTERPLLKNCLRLTLFSILLQYIRWVIFSWPSLLLSLTTTCNYLVRGGDTGSVCGVLVIDFFFISKFDSPISHTTICIWSLQTIISFLSPLQTINYVLHNKTVKFVEIIKCFLQILIELITVYYICKLLLNL